MSTSEEVLACEVLRGAATSWPASWGADFQARFLQQTRHHGVQPLLAAELRSSSADHEWPLEVRRALDREAAAQSALELLRCRESTRVMRALNDAGVVPLLMKGAPLAYGYYRSPELRPRADTDVLIRPPDRVAAERVLGGLGYTRVNATSGTLVSYELAMAMVDRFDVPHVIDVHWRVNNRQVFADALSYDECRAESVEIASLEAPALGPVHALLLACMHRVTHFTVPYQTDDASHVGDRLIWLYDIHLVASGLSQPALRRFAMLARDRGLSRVCLDGLRRAQRCFDTPIAREALDALSAPGPPEPSARYLDAGPLETMVSDIRSLPGWRDRLRLAREHLLPPADYVLKKYGRSSRLWLPALYMYRAVTGGWRLLLGK